jgi:hypothetical protein
MEEKKSRGIERWRRKKLNNEKRLIAQGKNWREREIG